MSISDQRRQRMIRKRRELERLFEIQATDRATYTLDDCVGTLHRIRKLNIQIDGLDRIKPRY